MLKIILIAISISYGFLFLLRLDESLPSIRREAKIHRNKKIRFRKIEDFQKRVALMLINVKSKQSVKNYFEVMVLLLLIGFFSGVVLFRNIFLGVVLSVGFPFLQFLFLLKKDHDVIRYNNEKLEIYMSLVTNSYIQSGNIESAVIDSYHRMDTTEAAAKPFEFFIAQSTGNADTGQCIQGMKAHYINRYFYQWCDKLTICRNNAKLKYVLPFVLKRMRRTRTLDTKTQTASYQSYRNFILCCLMSIVVTVLLPLQVPAWKYVVLNTGIGKIGVAIVVLVDLLASAYVVKVTSLGGGGS